MKTITVGFVPGMSLLAKIVAVGKMNEVTSGKFNIGMDGLDNFTINMNDNITDHHILVTGMALGGILFEYLKDKK